MRTFTCKLVLISLVVSVFPTFGRVYAQSTGARESGPIRRSKLYQDSRAELAAARVRGAKTVVLVIAAVPGQQESMIRKAVSVGGTVGFRDDDIDYLRVKVPIDQVDEVAEDGSVESVAIDETDNSKALLRGVPVWFSAEQVATNEPQEEPRQDEEQTSAEESAAPSEPAAAPGQTWSDFPMKHWYAPSKDVGAGELQKAHPTYDGRGITIGHVEFGTDLLLPELKSAVSLDGKIIPKYVDVLNTLDPEHVHENGDFANVTPWVSMGEPFTGEGTVVRIGDQDVTLPRGGRFRFGYFAANRACRYIGWTPSTPSVPVATANGFGPRPSKDLACKFGVLWDESTNEVWLDTNRNGSFADERAMTDYRVRHDIGVLGRDDPATQRRESMAFTIQTSPASKTVAINMGIGGHASMVAGSVAANKIDGGKVDGMAPAVQMIQFDWGGECLASLIEGLIKAFEDPRVDVVMLEQNVYAGPYYYRIGDGRFVSSVVLARLIEKYKKPFVVPADNNPNINWTTELGNVPWAFAVGAYQKKDTYRINRGLIVANEDNLHEVGAWGPSGVGGVKPDIVSPSGYLTTENDSSKEFRGAKGLYRIPSGYTIGGGTSQAAPMMAGALAILMSAAKQEHIPYDAKTIWLAVTNSARYIPNLQVHQQGNGAVDVDAALKLLKEYAKNPPSITITSKGPVRTPYASWFLTPNQGVSIWESQDWKAGDQQDRIITLTRTTGPKEPMTFTLSWRGNDGTFSTTESITLPLNKPTKLTVSVAPKTAGAHSALLTLDNVEVPGHAYRLMTTIIAAAEFKKESSFVLEQKDEIKLPDNNSYYFDIPAETEAIALDLIGAPVYLETYDPAGQYTSYAMDWHVPGNGHRVLGSPRPGTWTGVVNPRNLVTGGGDLDLIWKSKPGELTVPVPYTFTVAPFGARVVPEPGLSLKAGESRSLNVSVTNTLARFTGGLAPMAIGSVRATRISMKPYEQKVFDIRVPDGSPMMSAELDGLSPEKGDVDMYLFDCTGKECLPSQVAALNLGTRPRFRLLNPKPGLWKIVLDASRVPVRGVTFNYTDIIADSSLGGMTTSDAFVTRNPGAVWQTRANVWLAREPQESRLPAALFVVNMLYNGASIPIGMKMVALGGEPLAGNK